MMDGGCWFLYELCWRRKSWYSCSCSTVTVLKWRNDIISILFTFVLCLVFCPLRLEDGRWMLMWWRRKSWCSSCILLSGGSTSAPEGEPWGAREPIAEFTLGRIHLLAAAFLAAFIYSQLHISHIHLLPCLSAWLHMFDPSLQVDHSWYDTTLLWWRGAGRLPFKHCGCSQEAECRG